MTESRRELVLTALVAALVVAGILIDVVTDAVRSGPAVSTADRIVERAAYCPPAAEGATELRVAAVAERPDENVEAAIHPMTEDPFELAPGRSILRAVKDGLAQQIVGRGSTMVAGAATGFGEGRVTGLGGARCSRTAAARWYFAAGSSVLTADDRLLIHNPFPEDAVIGVVFVTPDGESSPANASDLAIPAGKSLMLRVNDFVTAERLLSAIVTADRGRVVAWRLMLEQPDALPEGVVSTLGAKGPAATWYFPAGHVQPGVREVISVLNPTDREALVTVSLATRSGAVQPRGLAEVRIPSHTSAAFSLPAKVGPKQANVGGASAIVAAQNNVAIVAERTAYYSTSTLRGIESEVGARTTSTGWALPPLAPDAATDRLSLLNPGAEPASISVTLYGPDSEPLQPKQLQGVRLSPGLRGELALDDIEGAGHMVAVVTSSQPVVAERTATSSRLSDIASVMGIVLGH
ncbi:MAG: hypothetical protein GEU78_02075 [Actinobacteria bacterium]|nr:hypothetical protein [Actinomycetota bacterium]